MSYPPSDAQSRRRLPLALGFLVPILALAPAAVAIGAPKTDVVVFLKGDKLTGEVKGLQRGKLNLSTDSAGTVSIDGQQDGRELGLRCHDLARLLFLTAAQAPRWRVSRSVASSTRPTTF